jgi:organic radical activating enzyme
MQLPAHLLNGVKISWHLSSWCNYSCPYCPVLVFHKRSARQARQRHAFDYYPVEQWVETLVALPYQRVIIGLNGGEPMLDRQNVHILLDRLTATGRFEISIETNGSWDPQYYQDLASRSIFLNVAFHPLDVDFETFFKRVSRIRDAGFFVVMVNLVLDPQNLPVIEKAVGRLEQAGFFVNLSAMQPSGIYSGRTERTRRELELIEAYNTPLDIKYKVLRPPSRGALCFYPALTYYLQYDGLIRVFCSNDPGQNLFTGGLPPLPREAVPCPYDHCVACNDMHRSLAHEPLQTTPLTFFTHREYVEEVKAYRRKQRRTRVLRALPLGIGRLFDSRHSSRALFEQAAREAAADGAAVAIPLTQIAGAPAEEPILGSVDESAGVIEAFSRDRIALSGWAAAAQRGPVRQIRIFLDTRELGTLEHFEPRPEIAASYGRPEWARSGWRTMVYLPALDPGEYQLRVQAVDSGGNTASLTAPRVRIVE